MTLSFANGEAKVSSGAATEPIAMTRRELTRIIFGSHPSLGPLHVRGPGEDLLRLVFPYYFPIWELDHC